MTYQASRAIGVLVIFSLLSLGCFTSFVEGALDAEAQTAILTTHNSARQGVSPAAIPAISNLAWSSTCETSAQSWANQCSFSHDPSLDTLNQGQNIYVTSSTEPVTAANYPGWVNAWVAEKQYYNIYTDTCQSGKVCGHYTQVVWADTTTVGCGYKICVGELTGWTGQTSGTLFVCNYAPPGNYNGEIPYEPVTPSPTPTRSRTPSNSKTPSNSASKSKTRAASLSRSKTPAVSPSKSKSVAVSKTKTPLASVTKSKSRTSSTRTRSRSASRSRSRTSPSKSKSRSRTPTRSRTRTRTRTRSRSRSLA